MKSAVLFLDPHSVEAPATLDAVVVNRGDRTLTYGLAYEIERWDGEKWRETDIAPDVFPLIAFTLEPGEQGEPNPVEIPADVKPGFYRVTKRVTEQATETELQLSALFQVC